MDCPETIRDSLRGSMGYNDRLLSPQPTKHNHNLTEIAQEYLDRSVTSYKEVVEAG